MALATERGGRLVKALTGKESPVMTKGMKLLQGAHERVGLESRRTTANALFDCDGAFLLRINIPVGAHVFACSCALSLCLCLCLSLSLQFLSAVRDV